MNLESFSYSVSDNNVLEVSAYQASKSLMSQLNPADPNYIVTKGVNWILWISKNEEQTHPGELEWN